MRVAEHAIGMGIPAVVSVETPIPQPILRHRRHRVPLRLNRLTQVPRRSRHRLLNQLLHRALRHNRLLHNHNRLLIRQLLADKLRAAVGRMAPVGVGRRKE